MTNMHVAISLAREILYQTIEGTVSTVLAGLIGSRQGRFVRFVRGSSFHTATTVHRHLEVINTDSPSSDAVGNVSLKTDFQESRSVPFVANFEPDRGLEVISVGIEPNPEFPVALVAPSNISILPGTIMATEQLDLLLGALYDHVKTVIRAFTVDLVQGEFDHHLVGICSNLEFLVDHWVLIAQAAHNGGKTTITRLESIFPLVGFFIFKVVLKAATA